MNNLGQSYKNILNVLELCSEHQILNYQRRKSKMSELEVISLNLTTEYLSFWVTIV